MKYLGKEHPQREKAVQRPCGRSVRLEAAPPAPHPCRVYSRLAPRVLKDPGSGCRALSTELKLFYTELVVPFSEF